MIPKDIRLRDELHWEPGIRLTLVSTTTGVTIRAISQKSGRRQEDLIGMLRHDGAPLSTDDLCKPVDYGADWDTSERCTV